MTKVDLWDETSTRQKYLITAGTNRHGRQQYAIVYSDIDNWDISVVPIPLSKTKALKYLAKIKKEYLERIDTRITFKYKFSNIEFNIVECPDNLLT